MRTDTDTDHEYVVGLGESLGLQAEREVSLIAAEGMYAPRLDVLWSQSLSAAQERAIREVGAHVSTRGGALPVAAWEIEGSDASTKGMQADLVNMRVSRAPYGFLAVRGDTKDNLYERARRLTRTQRHYFGDQGAVPMDTNWIPKLKKHSFSAALADANGKPARGGGGEGRWADQVRVQLRRLGERAGFAVRDSYCSLTPAAADFTKSEIDLVWTMPMPKGLRQLVEVLGKQDPSLIHDHLVVPARYDQVPIVAFEIENDSGKHGFGGLLNLAAHGVAGVFVAGDSIAFEKANAAHATYRNVLSLLHVSVHNGFFRNAKAIG